MRTPSQNYAHASYQSIPAYPAAMFRVEYGANMGDALGIMDDLVLDDVYHLCPATQPRRLSLKVSPEGEFSVGADTELGTPTAQLHLDCCITVLPDTGAEVDILIMVEVDAEGLITQVFLLPLAPLVADMPYCLIHADRKLARQKLAQMACVSFTRGTHITLASGAQVKIEELSVGDRVLTRDDGAQVVRWIGHTTSRAMGSMAPILIRKGALNNDNDLIVSPDHRLMVYQRQDTLGTGCPEVLVKAQDLVNGDTVVAQTGGFVDYFQLLFDRHHIIYAEGIAAESMLIDASTHSALPLDLVDHITPGLKHNRRDEHGVDVARTLLKHPNAVDLLRRASSG